MISFSQVTFSYSAQETRDANRRKRHRRGRDSEAAAHPPKDAVLREVSLTIPNGGFVGLAGHTGSGKSTVLKLMAGLLQPTAGSVSYQDGCTRTDIGLLFQYPERQLFSQTVRADVAYGPRMRGRSNEDVQCAVTWALTACGLPEECWDESPFHLSGGEQRRAALAGVLALEPQVLLLDEPTAGLDPLGRTQLATLLARLRRQGMTVVAASHDLDFLEKTSEIAVLSNGRLIIDGPPETVLAQQDILTSSGLDSPFAVQLAHRLHEHGMDVPAYCPDERTLAAAVAKWAANADSNRADC
ncbi:MAG: ATP-binding cassette domain-containing protein [Eggerthellaceae bacterium]|jgi:energy-coupling factor transporter ATP-binding protein EcfA2